MTPKAELESKDSTIIAGPDIKVSPVLLQIIVTDEQHGMRLDQVIAQHYIDLSRMRIKSLIKDGAVQNQAARIVTAPAHRVKFSEVYNLTMPPLRMATPQPQKIPLDIIYEDADLIVLNKPVGLVVHPGAGRAEGTLVNALLAHCADSLSGIGGVMRPGIVHRIDKDTSGLLVVAKSDAAHHGLATQFAAHDIERAYLAVVWGVPQMQSGRIVAPIGRDPRQRKRMAVVEKDGRMAITKYQLLDSMAGGAASLLHCTLETGRTHQIRVHLAAEGHAVIGDPVYGRIGQASSRAAALTLCLPIAVRPVVTSFARQALHARILGFLHPISGIRMNFERAPPPDLATLIQLLFDRNFA